ncbi:bifunctional fatty acid transporter and acyl-CoA synthetase [Hyaloscypha bicolor E]|uniref:Bifunctional fatty acid transporter and acyl-CoA synthetase n=1 Tax=Hyaloscypha bicolor E TaxID=1095630 RepID=A0A2J6T492_9HELO|nr:bifunctional fatty acid transporter and acyl-CoA synthetase [Hyaloscypha bicolor E]PMD57848.1 bifunctional fatty acid transporter and acyl-CoA synthetase [Hyaloscypha bicolor E]
MASLSNPQMLMAAAALFGATGAYLDARYGVSYDLRKLSQIRTSRKRVGERIRELGGEATLYRLLELADQGAEALWFEGRSLTYGEMKINVDQLAEFLRRHGVQAGHVVGVFCTNSPEMAFAIYALGKLGAVAALLNSALRNETLKHCIGISEAQLVVATPDLVEFVPSSTGVRELRRFNLNLGPGSTIITIGPNELSPLSPDPQFPRPVRTAKDVWILIFTSGTTELAESNATRLLYVGELLRYALSAPPSSYDKKHNCIVATGNGLQADVWERFQERFGIPEIREIYRSTESVSGFDNMCGGAIGVGKVGFSGPLGRFLEDTMFLVKYDQETQTLYRHPKTGFCIPVPDGEPGEAIGRVTMMDFYSDYYKDSSATSGKLAKDVFKKGDLFQRTGDLLVRESDGWVRFHERTGDTFRWRGENVSSAEVKAFMVQLPNVHDIVVYGTKVPGYDGQVGTAGITLLHPSSAAETTYLSTLYPHLRECGLPDYAIPRLVRFTKQIDIGITFKHAKDVLKTRDWKLKDGDDADHLYWLDGEQYRMLDEAAWNQIFSTARAKL